MAEDGWLDLPVKVRWSAEATATVPPETVWPLLVDLRQHLEWGGHRYEGKSEFLTELDAPEGPASVGIEFTSVGHAHEGTYHDRSTVTAVEPARLFEFVTRTAFRRGKGETRYWLRHRWRLEAVATGGTRVTHEAECLGGFEGAPIWFRALFVTPLKQLVGDRIAVRLLAGGVANLVAMAEEPGG